MRMKNYTWLIGISLAALFLGTPCALAQSPDSKDTIRYSGNMWMGEKFEYQQKERIRFKDIKAILTTDAASQLYVNKASDNRLFSTVFGMVGGFCIGYGIGIGLGSGEINTLLVAIRAGSIAVSIPFAIGYQSNIRKALTKFNQRL